MSTRPGEIEIRPYAGGDESQVVAFWSEVFPDPSPRNDPRLDLERKLAAGNELLFVAVRDAHVVGTAMGGYDGHRGWVYRVAVHPRLRRKGVGARLMQCVEAELDALGCPKLNLQVRGDNREAVGFYQKLGYRVEDRVSFGKVLPGAPGGPDQGD